MQCNAQLIESCVIRNSYNFHSTVSLESFEEKSDDLFGKDNSAGEAKTGFPEEAKEKPQEKVNSDTGNY